MSDNAQNTAEEIEMIRRFERSEIILHWSNAVPFLILFVTGALNVLSRFVIFSPVFLTALRTPHVENSRIRNTKSGSPALSLSAAKRQ